MVHETTLDNSFLDCFFWLQNDTIFKKLFFQLFELIQRSLPINTILLQILVYLAKQLLNHNKPNVQFLKELLYVLGLGIEPENGIVFMDLLQCLDNGSEGLISITFYVGNVHYFLDSF